MSKFRNPKNRKPRETTRATMPTSDQKMRSPKRARRVSNKSVPLEVFKGDIEFINDLLLKCVMNGDTQGIENLATARIQTAAFGSVGICAFESLRQVPLAVRKATDSQGVFEFVRTLHRRFETSVARLSAFGIHTTVCSYGTVIFEIYVERRPQPLTVMDKDLIKRYAKACKAARDLPGADLSQAPSFKAAIAPQSQAASA